MDLRAEARDITATWGPGTTNRQVLSALVAAASGNVSGSTAAFVQAGVVNFVQQQGAAYIGKLVAEGSLTEGSAEHAALHAIVACAGAAASSQSCGAGALGAATSSLVTNLFKEPEPGETSTQREAKANIINTIVAGTALALGGSAADQTATAVIASNAAVQNNYLTQGELRQMRAELSQCRGRTECNAVRERYSQISQKRNAEIVTTCLVSVQGCHDISLQLQRDLEQLGEDFRGVRKGQDYRDANNNLKQAANQYKTALGLLEDYGNRRLGGSATLVDLVKGGYLSVKEARDLATFKREDYLATDGQIGAITGALRNGPGARNTATALRDVRLIPGFSAAESRVISEARSVLTSAEIRQIEAAHNAGRPVTVHIGGRLIQYEPGLPASGMSLFGENGFIIGREAFSSAQEFQKTVLHELYRLHTSASGGVYQGSLPLGKHKQQKRSPTKPWMR